MKLLEVVQDHRRAFSTYHDHKEKTAYAATTLYVGAASWWAASGQFWTLARPLTIVISTVVAVVGGVMVWLFLSWQLRKRLDAATAEAACVTVEAKIVAEEINAEEPFAHCSWQGYRIPKPIFDEIEAGKAEQSRRLQLPMGLMYSAIIIWTVLVLVRIGAAAREICP